MYQEFSMLNEQELSLVNGGGMAAAIATGLVTIGTIGLTIAFPPAGIAVTALIVTGEVIGGAAGTYAAYNI